MDQISLRLFWTWPNIKYLWHKPNVHGQLFLIKLCLLLLHLEHALSASWDVPAVEWWLSESKELSFLFCDSFPNLNSEHHPDISHRAWLIDVLNWETLNPVTEQKETGGGRALALASSSIAGTETNQFLSLSHSVLICKVKRWDCSVTKVPLVSKNLWVRNSFQIAYYTPWDACSNSIWSQVIKYLINLNCGLFLRLKVINRIFSLTFPKSKINKLFQNAALFTFVITSI